MNVFKKLNSLNGLDLILLVRRIALVVQVELHLQSASPAFIFSELEHDILATPQAIFAEFHISRYQRKVFVRIIFGIMTVD